VAGAGAIRNSITFVSAVNSASGALVTSLSQHGSSQSVVACTPVPTATTLINEIVVEPQRDWDDSGGGGGIPFDDITTSATAPSAAITAADQWIEIFSPSASPAALNNWTLTFTNLSGALTTLTITPAMVTSNGSQYLVIGAPGGIAPTSLLTLRDSTNQVVDEVNLAPITAALGAATGIGNETVARIPDVLDTNQPTDFQRRPATIGKPNQ
jgi:hypothetical protein